MKRTVFTRLAMAVAVLQIFAAMNSVQAAESAKPAASGSAASAPTGAGADKAAAANKEAAPAESKAADGARDEDGMMVDLKVPLMSSTFAKTTIADVNGEKIPLEEFTEAVAQMHESMSDAKQGASATSSLHVLLKRLITTRLFVQEARNIELDQLPEIKEYLEQGNKKILREILYLRIASKAKPDEREVEKNYRSMTHEVKLRSIAFFKDADAKAFIQQVKSGKNFQEYAELAVQEKRGERPSEVDEFVKLAQLHPKVAQAVDTLPVKGITQPILVSDHYMVFTLVDRRTVDMPGQRDEARANLQAKAQMDALQAYKQQLYAKYLKKNTKLINAIDFEAKKPGFAALKTDKRALVTIDGKAAVTVADLAQGVEAKFFHGVELAIKEKKVNKEKGDILDAIMSRLAFDKEAEVQHLERSDEYARKSGEFVRSTLFGVFIEKVIRPEVKATDAELQEYYKVHADDFSAPEQVVIDGIVFKKAADAKSAMEKLRQGMDLRWLQANAEGLVGKDAPSLIDLREGPVAADQLPMAAQKALKGAKLGEYRIYDSPEGYQYVLHVAEIVPKQVRPYMEVREEIAKVIYGQKLAQVIDDWSDKLAQHATVKLYLQLKQKNPTP